eukprot:TRINITY_DN2157_c0_g1_i2.p1 TRINITY_DN2157_c0_g1~~TRINITY_DN2157_c0_g1_i2.p1  ORF type:complete len:205 (+),score=42.12 TRINITY_DN2157_c0_g1_i2:73-615(+)
MCIRDSPEADVFDIESFDLCEFINQADYSITCKGTILQKGRRLATAYVLNYFIDVAQSRDGYLNNTDKPWAFDLDDFTTDTIIDVLGDATQTVIQRIDEFIITFTESAQNSVLAFGIAFFPIFFTLTGIFYFLVVKEIESRLTYARRGFALIPVTILRRNKIFIKYLNQTSQAIILNSVG